MLLVLGCGADKHNYSDHRIKRGTLLMLYQTSRWWHDEVKRLKLESDDGKNKPAEEDLPLKRVTYQSAKLIPRENPTIFAWSKNTLCRSQSIRGPSLGDREAKAF